jgi:glycerol-3-phosphate O-acyltransferase/dihydroxyacetone phosphate acyltransferase
MNVTGTLVTAVVGFAGDIFYRRRRLAGAVPAAGPVLLVANHPNGLIDPLLVQRAAGRRVRMLAKAPLFSMPGVSLLVRALDCLPVYRSRDGADTAQNNATFAAVEEALLKGECVLIFPEGISHDEPQLQPLKTGAARMALQAYRAGAKDLVIVPIGLTYADKLRYRSTAAFEVGPPLAVGPFWPAASTNDDDDDDDVGERLRQAARDLTVKIDQALRTLTLNVEHWEDVSLLQAVDAIWRQDDPEQMRRLKTLADGVDHLRRVVPDELDDVRGRLSAWVDDVHSWGLSPRDLGDDGLLSSTSLARRVGGALRHVVVAVAALPWAAFGALFWAVPFWAVHAVWLWRRPERDVGATVKVLAGLVFFPLWFVTVVVALGWATTPLWAFWTAVVAPGAGMMTRHYLRRRAYALRSLVGGLRALLSGRTLDRLRRERMALCAAFDRFGNIGNRPEVVLPVGPAPRP